MTHLPAVTLVSLLMLVVGLGMAAAPAAKSPYWVSEVQGASMWPALCGARTAFVCLECGRRCELDIEEAAQVSVFRCSHCNTWQRTRNPVARLSGDRVILLAVFDERELRPGAIVAVEHPIFGMTGKRIDSVTPRGYFVVGDNEAASLDSRNPRFGLVSRDQIRGVVVKILRDPASTAQAK
jgi:DNA-directed RNA polymerase subunit RPC12/RpoP